MRIASNRRGQYNRNEMRKGQQTFSNGFLAANSDELFTENNVNNRDKQQTRVYTTFI